MRIPRNRFMGFTVLCALVGSFVPGVATASPQSPEIRVLSNRADLVSGGDALVEVTVPSGTEPGDVRVELDGRDITDEFGLRANGRYQGIVTGLRQGANELTARTSSAGGASITVTNHSKQGPVFAGRQVQPFICETHLHDLGPATGPSCEAPTRYDYFYKSTATGKLESYDTAAPPADALIAKTTTDQGKTLPYIPRRERGVIDRGIYDIAVLFDPGAEWKPWAPQGGWNGKLFWAFVGGYAPSHRQAGGSGGPEGGSEGNVLSVRDVGDLPLSRGYAVASSTLTWQGNNADDVVAAEALMMTKEHLIETYGPVRFTSAIGASGGSILQYTTANNYPGLVDGLMPIASYADVWQASHTFHDCSQLDRYFNLTSPQLWADITDRGSVTGEPNGCTVFSAVGADKIIFDPRTACTDGQPDWVYDPQTNPGGVRCTQQDYQGTDVFGERSSDGFANRPLDDVGVQWGLTSLLNGTISPEQFADLNAKIGGRDIDYNWTARRTEADVDGVRNAYRSGRVVDASQLDRVPIMEVRLSTNVEFHPSVYSEFTRARLIAANGHANNHVTWTAVGTLDATTGAVMWRGAFDTLDQWLTAIEGDSSGDPVETKVVRNKPTQAKNTCWIGGEAGACGTSGPTFSSARLDAGMPMASDVLKCQLKPIDWNDYGTVSFTDAQKQQLQGAFPDGVCDWTKPGVEQQPAVGVWQTFADTVGGRPLPPAPQSTPLTSTGPRVTTARSR